MSSVNIYPFRPFRKCRGYFPYYLPRHYYVPTESRQPVPPAPHSFSVAVGVALFLLGVGLVGRAKLR